MEPDRFDDVESRILEAPEPPPRPPIRRRSVALALAGAIAIGGGLSAGASAITGSGDEPAAKPKRSVMYNADGVPTVRNGFECEAGKGGKAHKRSRSSGPRY